MAKQPSMSTEFARWYAEVFMDEATTRAARWKGVTDVAAEANHITVEVLVRLAYPTAVAPAGGKNENLEETYRAVVSTISGGDASFDPAHSGRELQVLAAATLARLFPELSDAALAVTTASFGGSRQPDLPMDLADMAEKALSVLSRRQHGRTDEKELQAAPPKLDFAVSAEALQAMDPTLWKNELERLSQSATTALATLVSNQNRIVGLLHRQIMLDEEELQMLWWLTGGRSRQLNKPFVCVEEALKPLTLGRELGDMTMISPGPSSIGAMLAKAGVGETALKVQDAVNAVEIEWAHEVSRSARVSPVTTPLHFALEKRAEVKSTVAWQAGWSALTGLSVETELPAATLAEMFYREFLFLHVGD